MATTLRVLMDRILRPLGESEVGNGEPTVDGLLLQDVMGPIAVT